MVGDLSSRNGHGNPATEHECLGSLVEHFSTDGSSVPHEEAGGCDGPPDRVLGTRNNGRVWKRTVNDDHSLPHEDGRDLETKLCRGVGGNNVSLGGIRGSHDHMGDGALTIFDPYLANLASATWGNERYSF